MSDTKDNKETKPLPPFPMPEKVGEIFTKNSHDEKKE